MQEIHHISKPIYSSFSDSIWISCGRAIPKARKFTLFWSSYYPTRVKNLAISPFQSSEMYLPHYNSIGFSHSLHFDFPCPNLFDYRAWTPANTSKTEKFYTRPWRKSRCFMWYQRSHMVIKRAELMIRMWTPQLGVLLEKRNLVLRGNGNEETKLWMSFDHPTDTLMPGMKDYL